MLPLNALRRQSVVGPHAAPPVVAPTGLLDFPNDGHVILVPPTMGVLVVRVAIVLLAVSAVIVVIVLTDVSYCPCADRRTFVRILLFWLPVLLSRSCCAHVIRILLADVGL